MSLDTVATAVERQTSAQLITRPARRGRQAFSNGAVSARAVVRRRVVYIDYYLSINLEYPVVGWTLSAL